MGELTGILMVLIVFSRVVLPVLVSKRGCIIYGSFFVDETDRLNLCDFFWVIYTGI